MSDAETQWVAPYIAFRTLLDLIERMAKGTTPPKIDRSYLENYSSGYRSQVLAALTALGLIAEDGTVLDPLRNLISSDEATRKALVRQLIQSHYPEAVELSKINGTTKQLEDIFAANYGLIGNTKAKGIAFYLKASQWAGVPTSPNFRTPKTTPNTRKRRPPPPPPPGEPIPGPAATIWQQGDSGGTPYMVNLASGGTVRLSVQVDLFGLSEEDRAFVFGLVDLVRRYQAKAQESPDAKGRFDRDEEVTE